MSEWDSNPQFLVDRQTVYKTELKVTSLYQLWLSSVPPLSEEVES
jgi:hypothetical protein